MAMSTSAVAGLILPLLVLVSAGKLPDSATALPAADPPPALLKPTPTRVCAAPLTFTPLPPLAAGAVRLRFDPDFSPPSTANAIAQPALYRAYNRPVFSRTRRPIKVRIETDSGMLISSGPDASLVIKLTSVTGYLENREYPGEKTTVDELTANGQQWLFRFAGSEHVYDPMDHAIVKWSSIEVRPGGKGWQWIAASGHPQTHQRWTIRRPLTPPPPPLSLSR